MAKKTTIRCPHCNQEYLPGEIYYPNNFLGQPWNVIKDEKGDILGHNGDDMNTYETFYCDKCGKKFYVDATVMFKTGPVEDLFDNDEEDFKDIVSK